MISPALTLGDNKRESMDNSGQNMFFNTVSVHSVTLPWGFYMDHQQAPLREQYGIAFHVDSSCWGGRHTYIPFQNQLGLCDYSSEPAFIRKRNERERERVRCVNEGYARLRQHLPLELAEKRLSKVETLRAAIEYIKHLQNILDLGTLRPPVTEPFSNTETSISPVLYLSTKSSIQRHCAMGSPCTEEHQLHVL
ncbi:achaete-scute homolog 3 [Xenopus tropicalis]|uniref:Achaete-scute family bHLH transcription factor 3 n=1 Tax=Xenopus tropicalis TaxID=8364 RepID=A0A803K482_XENTR|nr:achaete-scute homolog 3 [Xenopus tropicalis]